MEVTGAVPVKRVKDRHPSDRQRGGRGGGHATPSRTSVSRTVYEADGTVISEETWNTSYKGETRVVRVGTKPKPEGTGAESSEEALWRTAPRRRAYAAGDAAVHRLGEPGRHPRRPVRLPVDRRMLCVAVRDELVTADDAVLVAKARPADVHAANPDRQPLVEVRRAVVANVNLRRQRFHPALANRLIPARVSGEMLDAGDLEPDDERRRGARCPARRSRRTAP